MRTTTKQQPLLMRAAAVLLLALLTMTAQTAWAIGGSGTSSDPYTIANASDWSTFCSNFSSYRSKYIKLTGNFTTSTVVTSGEPFTGKFDGEGHTITLNYSHDGTATGLFRYVDAPGADIRNLNVAGTINATQNCTPGSDGIGGIVGKLGQGTVQNCTSSVTINDNGQTLGHVGGVVGAIYAATVQDCSFTGTLNCGNSSDCIGGIVGYARFDKSFYITNCLSTGSISVNNATNAGAILGYVRNNDHTAQSKNNYWKSNGVNKTCGGGSIGGTSKTDAELKSGQISRLLNGGNGSTEKANRAWGNTVGSNYPSPGGPAVYKVSFNANGGSGSMGDAYYNATPLPSNPFTRSGYGFGGWSTSANGSPISKVSSDGTLYALWIPPVNYIDADGSSKSVIARPLLGNETNLSAGWYVVNNDVTISSRVSCEGAVHLILADGKTFTAQKGIAVNSGKSLTIYGQSEQTGKLTTGTEKLNNYIAGIGGDDNKSSGTITINGGTINVTGGNYAAGIGGGKSGSGNVTINGGTVNATGGINGAGIGGGNNGSGNVTINGGTVNATGGINGAGIGGGTYKNGTVAISGGYVKTTAGTSAAAIGNGYTGSGNTINITGGMFASGDAGGNKVYDVTPSSGYGVFSSGNATYPYQVCPATTVTFKANGGNGGDHNQYIKKNTATALTTCGFTRENYAFAGWNTAADGTGTNYANLQSVTLTTDLTLYAQWKVVMTSGMIANIPAQQYTGSALTPVVKVNFDGHDLTQGTDYTVSYANNVNAGTATVTVTGKGNYTGTAMKSFQIYSDRSLEGASITLPYTHYAYKEAALTPSPTVKYGETTLTLGTDYTLLYSNNTNAGTATVTVTGKGNYQGTGSATFTIVSLTQSSGKYQIGTPEQLLAFMELCNDNSSTTYSALQTADISLSGKTWHYIDNFKGTYDGQNHTISNMSDLANPSHGMINVIAEGAEVKNLKFHNVRSLNFGGAVAFRNNGTISHVTVDASTLRRGDSSDGLGGICGENNTKGIITDCAVVNSSICHQWGQNDTRDVAFITEKNNGTVSNCLSYNNTSRTSELAHTGVIVHSGNAPVNSYYYITTNITGNTQGTAVTADQCGSGQTARLLNGGGTTESASGAWGQTIGTDKYPVLGGTPVYKVTYNANGGTGTMDAQYLNSGQALAACGFNAPEYYHFNGWNTSQDGTGTKYNNLAGVTLTSDLVLYAQWGPWAGTGTEDDPYIIEYASQLDLLASRINGTHGETLQSDGYSGKYFQLANDIDYSHDGLGNTDSNFEAIGGYYNGNDRYFKGDFDGAGYTISGIRIYKGADKFQGIFGQIGSDAIIHDLTLADAHITGHDYTGGIVGYNLGGIVSGCHVEADVAVCAVKSNAHFHGGIVGNNAGGTIEKCASAVNLSLADGISGWYYGGIAGHNSGLLRDNLAIGAIVPATDDNSYGAITCVNEGGILERNYYAACTVANTENATGVGCGYINNSSVADVTTNDGAVSIHTLTLADGVSTTTGAPVSYNNIDYYAQGTTIALSYNGTIDEGYQLGIFYKDDYACNKTADNGTATMPAANATAKVSVIPWAGSGDSEADPYIIEYASQLDLLASRVNGTHGETLQSDGYSGKYFQLANDIDYDHTGLGNTDSNYEAIGGYFDNGNRYFCGDFDGAGYTISGIRIYKGGDDFADSYQGIFGQTGEDANIHDLTLADARITGHDYTGGIVGNNAGGIVSDCHVEADVAVCAVQSYADYHGGIVGHNGGTISGCTSAVNLSLADGISECMDYGGIAGENYGTLTGNLAIGATVPATDYNSHGAIVGYNTDTLQRNYYSACKVASESVTPSRVGCGFIDDGNGGLIVADVTTNDGAVSIHTLTLADGVSTTTDATVTHNNINYYAQGTTIALSYSGTIGAGYQLGIVSNDGYACNKTADNGTATMPAANATAKVSVIPWAGSGDSEDDPYIIEYASQLDLLAHRVNGTHGEALQSYGYIGKYFQLANDITYTHTNDWNSNEAYESNYEAIGGYFGDNFCYFDGDFDGAGHTISGIRIYKGADQYQGIFGRTGSGADIHDLTLADARITGYDQTGGIVGRNNGGNVSNCYVADDVAVCAVQNDTWYHGGIAGQNYGGTIEQCTSAVTLTLTDASGSKYYGGIAGSNGGTLSDNLAIGAIVPATDDNSYGAITGQNTSNGTLERNYYTACKVANVENATGVGCQNADVTTNDGAVPYMAVTFAPEGYATFYDSRVDLVLPAGTKAYVVSAEGNAEGTLTYEKIADGNDANDNVVPAKTAVLLQTAAATEANSVQPTLRLPKADAYDGTNLLHGSDVETTTTGGGIYYKLTYDNDDSNFGWYWGADNGAAFTSPAHKAWLALPSAGARVFIGLPDDDETTGAKSLTPGPSPKGEGSDSWFTLDGRRLNGKPTTKGLYIINGKKVIIK